MACGLLFCNKPHDHPNYAVAALVSFPLGYLSDKACHRKANTHSRVIFNSYEAVTSNRMVCYTQHHMHTCCSLDVATGCCLGFLPLWRPCACASCTRHSQMRGPPSCACQHCGASAMACGTQSTHLFSGAYDMRRGVVVDRNELKSYPPPLPPFPAASTLCIRRNPLSPT